MNPFRARFAACLALALASVSSASPIRDDDPAHKATPNDAVFDGKASDADGGDDLPERGGPPNDDCSGAFTIFCGSTTLVSNAGASTAADDPAFSCRVFGPLQGRNTIWFRFQATSLAVDVSLCNPGTGVIDTLLAVYSGTCGAFTEIACNDDGGSGCGPAGRRSRLTATGLVPGQFYYIQAASSNGLDVGQMELTLTCAPSNPDLCSAARIISCDSTVVFDNTSFGTAPDDPAFSCHSSETPQQGYHTGWFVFIAQGDIASISLCNPGTVPSDTLLALYSGACGNLTEIACNDDGGSPECGPGTWRSRLIATGLVPGQLYFIQTAGYAPVHAGQMELSLECIRSIDDCERPQPIACGGSVVINTSGFTTDPSDPPFSCRYEGQQQGYSTAWFTFTAQKTQATLSLCAPETIVVNTLLAVYSGSCGSFTEIACNDDAFTAGCGPYLRQSRVTVSGLTVGQTYYVQVAGWRQQEQGQIELSVDCVSAIDDCAGAARIACDSSLTFNSSGFTTEPADPAFNCHVFTPQQGWYTAWFTFVPQGRRVDVSVCTPGTFVNDTLLAVYSGSCGAFTEIACNDDGGGGECGPAGYRSRLSVEGLISGLTYYIQVAGWSPSEQGQIELSLTCYSVDDCEAPWERPCNSSELINLSPYTTDPDDPAFGCHFGGPAQGFYTVWGTFVAQGPQAELSTCHPDSVVNDTLLAVYSGTCGALTEIACNDDGFAPNCGPDGYRSRLTVSGLTAGQLYYFQLAGWDPSQRGLVRFSITCPADCNANGVSDAQDIAAGTSRDCFSESGPAGARGGPNGVPDECECLADWNRDGVTNSTDVSDFINTYFADQASGAVNGDINCNGVTNSTDVSDFINIWFAAQAGQLPFAGCVI